jgi:hypothetical protein
MESIQEISRARFASEGKIRPANCLRPARVLYCAQSRSGWRLNRRNLRSPSTNRCPAIFPESQFCTCIFLG